MPEPAVNSFGGAVLGKWLYVYGGHAGPTHRYSVESAAKHFRRPDLEDRATWEELPMGEDLQGVTLVSDGRALYWAGRRRDERRPQSRHLRPEARHMVEGAGPARGRPDRRLRHLGLRGRRRLYISGMSGRIYRLADSGGAWEAIGAWTQPRITHRLLPGPAGSLPAVGGSFRGKQTPIIESVPLGVPRRESDRPGRSE